MKEAAARRLQIHLVVGAMSTTFVLSALALVLSCLGHGSLIELLEPAILGVVGSWVVFVLCLLALRTTERSGSDHA